MFTASLSWGEDVYYCVEDLRYKIEKDDPSGSFELQPYLPEKYTLKYDADSNQLTFKGRIYGSDGVVMKCRMCIPKTPFFDAVSSASIFSMNGDRFLRVVLHLSRQV